MLIPRIRLARVLNGDLDADDKPANEDAPEHGSRNRPS